MSDKYVWVLSGDTYEYREQLKRMGFVWHAEQKAWHRLYDPLALQENGELRRWLRELRGVTMTQENARKFGYYGF